MFKVYEVANVIVGEKADPRNVQLYKNWLASHK